VELREIERQPEAGTAGSGGIETNQDIAQRHFSSRVIAAGVRPEKVGRKARIPSRADSGDAGADDFDP